MMRSATFPTVAALAMVLFVVACATSRMAPEGPGATRESALGPVFTDAEGMTLYIFAEDRPGISTCAGVCAVVWPPVEAGESARAKGDFSVISRDDGGRQWAYRGQPLYRYLMDDGPGDTSGDGVDGVWRAAMPTP